MIPGLEPAIISALAPEGTAAATAQPINEIVVDETCTTGEVVDFQNMTPEQRDAMRQLVGLPPVPKSPVQSIPIFDGYNMVFDYPPNIDKIDAILHSREREDVIYTYGWAIYNPNRILVSEALIAHEYAHAVSQDKFEGGPEAWWDKYLSDADFRYQEELDGHAAEYFTICGPGEPDRERVGKVLYITAMRVSSKLYGHNKTLQQAIKDLKARRVLDTHEFKTNLYKMVSQAVQDANTQTNVNRNDSNTDLLVREEPDSVNAIA